MCDASQSPRQVVTAPASLIANSSDHSVIRGLESAVAHYLINVILVQCKRVLPYGDVLVAAGDWKGPGLRASLSPHERCMQGFRMHTGGGMSHVNSVTNKRVKL